MNGGFSNIIDMEMLGNSLHSLENIIEIIPTDCLPDQEQYPVSFYVNKVTLSIIQPETTFSGENYNDDLETKNISDDELFKKPPSIDEIEKLRKIRRKKFKTKSRKTKRKRLYN